MNYNSLCLLILDMKKIAIIGGGISGITSAIKFAQNKHNRIDIFEKRSFILKGPPYCHLHAGGILYPEILLEDAQILLRDSIQFANRFNTCLNYRPVIVAYHIASKYSTESLVFKCKVNKLDYEFSPIHPLGKVENFYAVYQLSDMIHYKKYGKLPESNDVGRAFHDPYVEQFCKLLDDIYSIKYPFVSVNELGIDKDKVEEQLIRELSTYKNINIVTNKEIQLDELSSYNIIVNASGKNIFTFNENKIQEIYEFKSSWIIKTHVKIQNIPEIAIIGERGTKNGMIQITPISNGTFQVHCMRDDSTIINTFNNFEDIYISDQDIEKRGNIAIREISKLFSVFILGKVDGACPGLQRIPYDTKSKRTSGIKTYKIDDKIYIDIQTVKACSIISVVNEMFV